MKETVSQDFLCGMSVVCLPVLYTLSPLNLYLRSLIELSTQRPAVKWLSCGILQKASHSWLTCAVNIQTHNLLSLRYIYKRLRFQAVDKSAHRPSCVTRSPPCSFLMAF